MSVRTWQIFYREIDRAGNITFRGTRPLRVIFDEEKAKRYFKSLKSAANINQSYEMYQVSPDGSIESTVSTLGEDTQP